jgi:SAM-dependent methyltransferase
MTHQAASPVTDTDRLARERELHDALRGDLKHNAHYTSNKKFYSIATLNVRFVDGWLRQRVSGAKVLDYCCGDGLTALFCASAGAQAWGIDISPVSVENARAAARAEGLDARTTFEVMDAEATAFDEGFFDVIVVNGVLHHLDLTRAYPELARILKPDGEIICIEGLRHNALIHAYRRLTPHLRSEWEVAHILGKRDIEQARYYFGRVEVARFFHLATIAAVPFRDLSMFSALLRALDAVDRLLLKVPVLKWQAWMAVFVLGRPLKRPAGQAAPNAADETPGVASSSQAI